MYRSRIRRALAAAAAAAALAGWLAGCSSDIAWDRRETVALSSGDAVAANTAIQVVDPWPPYSANKNLAANGQRMQSAVERYRNNQVIPPVSAMTSDVTPASPAAPAQAAAAPSSSSGASTTSTAASQ